MSILVSQSTDDINIALEDEGTVTFYLSNGNGKTFAEVTIVGSGHELTLTAAVQHQGRTKVGTATIMRWHNQYLTDWVIASAFGMAYARAVDPKPAPQPRTQYIDGTIDLGDYVECPYLALRGVVVDILAERSARKGEHITGYVINSGSGETTISVDHTKLLMKGL